MMQCFFYTISRVGLMPFTVRAWCIAISNPKTSCFAATAAWALGWIFGVSQWEGADLSLTPTGTIIGTPYCMSPEQTVGGAVDQRADLYAAGVIFYQMLTGKRPFTARNLPALLLAIHSDPVPPLPAGVAGLSARHRSTVGEEARRKISKCR